MKLTYRPEIDGLRATTIKIFEILSNVLVNRGIKNFILELYDLFFIDFKYQSKTFLRLHNNSENYVPFYSILFHKCMSFIIKDINLKVFSASITANICGQHITINKIIIKNENIECDASRFIKFKY